MGSETQTIIIAVCMLCAFCAIAATGVCLWLFRSVRNEIRTGDNGVKDHGEAALREIRASVHRIEETQTRREEQMEEMQQSISRVEATSEAESTHVLRPRDLGKIHEKINGVATDVARLEGKSEAQYNALHEQLTLLQRTLNTRSTR